jgi:hypothetical protein
MELSPMQRSVSFLAIVLVLAGLCVYLFLPSVSGAAGRAPARAHRSSAPPASPGSPAATSPARPGGQAAPPDIYRWLPFSRAGLTAAASVTEHFAADYGTFSFTDSTAAYLAPMRPLVTSQLAQLLGRAFGTPGLAATRTSQRQTSTATATISALRSFGPTSLTFLVTIAQRITGTKGPSKQSGTYAITVTGNGTSWHVSDIELASAGNL